MVRIGWKSKQSPPQKVFDMKKRGKEKSVREEGYKTRPKMKKRTEKVLSL